jgi:hypothetical protein
VRVTVDSAWFTRRAGDGCWLTLREIFMAHSKYIHQFLWELEGIIQGKVRDNYPDHWDENYITEELFKEFTKRFRNIRIHFGPTVMEINLNAFKLRGKHETAHGDIAMLFQIRAQFDQQMEGVGFLEAKKLDHNRPEFSAIDFGQLSAIYNQTKHGQLLLYCFQDVHNFTRFPELILPYYENYHYRELPYTYLVSMPLSTAIQLNRKDSALLQWTQPFSHQLAFRYFFGYDLDFSPDLISAIKAADPKLRKPKYVLSFGVAHAGKAPEGIFPNSDAYELIKNE